MEFVAESDHEQEEVLRWRTMLGVLSSESIAVPHKNL
jgi:hypothetical protein